MTKEEEQFGKFLKEIANIYEKWHKRKMDYIMPREVFGAVYPHFWCEDKVYRDVRKNLKKLNNNSF